MTATQPATVQLGGKKLGGKKLGGRKKAVNPKLLIVLGVVFLGSLLFKFSGSLLKSTSTPKLAPVHAQPFHHTAKAKGSPAPAPVVFTNRDPFAPPAGYTNR